LTTIVIRSPSCVEMVDHGLFDLYLCLGMLYYSCISRNRKGCEGFWRNALEIPCMNYENWTKDQGCNDRDELSLLQNVYFCQGDVQLTFVQNAQHRSHTFRTRPRQDREPLWWKASIAMKFDFLHMLLYCTESKREYHACSSHLVPSKPKSKVNILPKHWLPLPKS
jgi:hypothetical protein